MPARKANPPRLVISGNQRGLLWPFLVTDTAASVAADQPTVRPDSTHHRKNPIRIRPGTTVPARNPYWVTRPANRLLTNATSVHSQNAMTVNRPTYLPFWARSGLLMANAAAAAA